MASSWLADRRLTDRQREHRREDRNERLLIRRNEFQRDTLLNLQVASQKLLRKTGASLHQDRMAFQTTGEWQRQLLPDGLSDDHLHLSTEVTLLASRIRNDEVRDLVVQLRNHTFSVVISKNQGEAEAHMTDAANIQGSLIETIGRLLRELDQADEKHFSSH